MSGQGIEIRGVMSGGLLAAIARYFFTRESFFMTSVENSPRTGFQSRGDVMLSPTTPGGIALHRLVDGAEFFLTSGSYVASDEGVKVTSKVQLSGLTNPLLSGTGLFLLRATGHGSLALSAFGSIHKYELQAGETRAVDNGHILAWSASMRYKTSLASSNGSIFSRILDSTTSGEGLMCFFEGPGIVFIQSHKPNLDENKKGANTKKTGRKSWWLIAIFFFMATIIFCAIVMVSIMYGLRTRMVEDENSVFPSGMQNFFQDKWSDEF
eukprot:CAMPEP_0113312920 /NCGR_PEP_ID=MMETSP0010_2-20120614/9556_1 /TAXON_ID=216773 ORGANISM="Corethron hystrix, Strain 308" /NCGR_SAMPLE_ID=MMETSP0010_2 /ASSEMBLY_ACC=CAM_ASM_000155 /LENGTH=266 /DNA_ID=CAMNT_0000168839 /DNA_START=266 /DNA_END=1066 /DNA_ORIENTATION=- /assembly_acc=CAM_ASM_000155